MKQSNIIHRITNSNDLPNQTDKKVIMEASNETEGLLTITTFPEGQDHNAYYFHLEEAELAEYINFLKAVQSDLKNQKLQ